MADDIKHSKKKVKGRRRTTIPMDNIIPKASVTSLRFEDMVIGNGKGINRYFNRLRYKGVPTVKQIEIGNEIHAGRDEVVRWLYDLFIEQNQDNSLISYFTGLVTYFRYIDDSGYQGEAFDNGIMSICIKYYNMQRLKGKEVSKAIEIKKSLSWLLGLSQRGSDARKLPKVKASEPSKVQVAFHVETELKPISKILVKGFRCFMSHIKANTYPDMHPMYIEALLEERCKKNNWTKEKLGYKRKAFSYALRVPISIQKESLLDKETLTLQLFANQAGRNALYVLYMLTGMNKGVLASLRHSDVYFKDIGNGRYVFDGEKARANHKSVDNALGFSKRTKELIEDWLEVSAILYRRLGYNAIGELPLIPYFESSQGEVLDIAHHKARPELINRMIEKLLGLKVNASRFRKTKSDVLMRVTEDVLLVSLGLNNEIQTVSQTYTSGVQADHDNNLNATFSAQMAIAKGNSIADSVSDAKILHSDILSDYDYKVRLRERKVSKTTMTPTGIHCQGASEEKLASEVKKVVNLGIDLSDDEKKCTDFIGCFDCESHLLVASERDIWLMLSFLEQLLDLKEQVSKNSAPKKVMFEVEVLLARTLDRVRGKSPTNYNKASEKVKAGIYHPLYLSKASLKQFFEK